jgi:hypothetical protein
VAAMMPAAWTTRLGRARFVRLRRLSDAPQACRSFTCDLPTGANPHSRL